MYYDYFEKDHLGNVRIVLTDQLETDMYPACTMELKDSTATIRITVMSLIQELHYRLDIHLILLTVIRIIMWQKWMAVEIK